MRLLPALIVGCWLAASATTASAQIAGMPVSCVDFRGVPVTLKAAANLPDVGAARIEYGMPVIYMNPGVLQQQPVEMQLFWYAHECAHHALGHLAYPNLMNEAAADCWAVRVGRSQGWFPPYAFQYLVQVLGNSPGSLWGHLPGHARIQNMAQCYNR